jgi:RNA-directed DNA polymerase
MNACDGFSDEAGSVLWRTSLPGDTPGHAVLPDPRTSDASSRSAQQGNRTDSQVIGEAIAAMSPETEAVKPALVTTAAAVLKRTPSPSASAIAATLAQAFLASPEWSPAGLRDAATQVLGARRRWLGPLVSHVLQGYPRPPTDAPRELAARIRHAEPFAEALAKATRQRKPLRLANYVLAPAVARENRPPRTPRIDTLADLAQLLQLTLGELDWFADTQHWNRTSTRKLQHYRYLWRSRSGRLPRLLEVPAPRLRAIQRTVLRELLYPIELHDAAHGFVPGRSAVTGAALHTGQEVVVNLDLVTFFANVTAGRVFGTLRQAGFTEAVAHRLTGICTHRVPPRVLSMMPPGGDPEQRFALRHALSQPHLPQGSPTSPMLANLSLRRLDSRLAGLAEKFDGVYTRYADDLAFSGGSELARRADAFIASVTAIVQDEGHGVNRLKTRVRQASVRQVVTSVVVNQRTNMARSEFDRLKAVLHNCHAHGPKSQNQDGHPDFRGHLLGRISWAAALNQERGAKLLQDFHRIQW